jgi:hypothetical protein
MRAQAINKAAIWAAGHHTATGSSTPGRTPTAPTPGGAAACTASNRTR